VNTIDRNQVHHAIRRRHGLRLRCDQRHSATTYRHSEDVNDVSCFLCRSIIIQRLSALAEFDAIPADRWRRLQSIAAHHPDATLAEAIELAERGAVT
jgi:hypothetical protein